MALFAEGGPVMRKSTAAVAVLLVAAWCAAAAQAQTAKAEEKVSRFGEYRGYSAPIYDSWVRTSRYLTMRDGVRLAADIIRPAVKGKVADKPLPAIFTHTRYHRASPDKDGKVESEADSPVSQVLLRHGYVLVVVDVRGSGASFGTWQGLFNPAETADGREIIEWTAAQPWCDGMIGMSGGSYLGATQLMAASTKPPHLKAIFPIVPPFDIYDIAFHNGVYFNDILKTWSDMTVLLDTKYPVAPVDEDRDGSLLKAAVSEHAGNRLTLDLYSPPRYRDSLDATSGAYVMRDWQPSGHVAEITASAVPTYLWAGWFDSFTRDVLLMYRNFRVPGRLVVGSWPHSPRDPELLKEEIRLGGVEQLRWFDRWLKGIDNGITAEPAVRYQVMKSPKAGEWKTSAVWPPAEAAATDFFFEAGPSGSVASANDGGLVARRPSGAGRDAYSIDYSTTTGTATRWDNAVGGDFGYPDMTANDRKGLTYTTAPLERDIEVTGHPVVHLWVSSTAGNGDYFAYLEEVDPAGGSAYVTEGAAKASFRAVGTAPYDNLGLPYHRGYQEDVAAPKPGEAVELVFDLQPTSIVFDAGQRIRLTITCADKDNAETPALDPAPTVTVYRDGKRPSRITLPVVGGLAGERAEDAAAKGKAGSALTYALFITLVVVVLVIAFTFYLRQRIKERRP
jgi:putative CocE/NonD family hydrolase